MGHIEHGDFIHSIQRLRRGQENNNFPKREKRALIATGGDPCEPHTRRPLHPNKCAGQRTPYVPQVHFRTERADITYMLQIPDKSSSTGNKAEWGTDSSVRRHDATRKNSGVGCCDGNELYVGTVTGAGRTCRELRGFLRSICRVFKSGEEHAAAKRGRKSVVRLVPVFHETKSHRSTSDGKITAVIECCKRQCCLSDSPRGVSPGT